MSKKDSKFDFKQYRLLKFSKSPKLKLSGVLHTLTGVLHTFEKVEKNNFLGRNRKNFHEQKKF